MLMLTQKCEFRRRATKSFRVNGANLILFLYLVGSQGLVLFPLALFSHVKHSFHCKGSCTRMFLSEISLSAMIDYVCTLFYIQLIQEIASFRCLSSISLADFIAAYTVASFHVLSPPFRGWLKQEWSRLNGSFYALLVVRHARSSTVDDACRGLLAPSRVWAESATEQPEMCTEKCVETQCNRQIRYTLTLVWLAQIKIDVVVTPQCT